MRHPVLASVSVTAVLAALVLLPAAPAAAQNELRTGWGDPDLQGIWDFRTITPLERPAELGDRAFLTAEEAANLEQEVVDRNTELANRAARRTTATESVDRGEEGAPGFYNNFWLDRGTRTVGTRRTSLVVDPPNGRLPEMSPEGRERTDARRAYRRDHPADSWLDRSAFDRCILGFNAGPPITPGGYNQNLQVFQTPDEVVLVTEMVHTVRVVPLDGRPALPGHVRQWSGDSRGRWEGDTLRRPGRARGRLRFRCSEATSRCTSTPATRGTTACPGSWAGIAWRRRPPPPPRSPPNPTAGRGRSPGIG